MDRETNFKDDNSNTETQTSWESDFNNEDQKWDAETLCGRENDFSIKDQEIGADSNKKMLSDKAIWATIEYNSLNFIVLNL